MDFRERLREEISFSGLSYKEIAERADISKRTVISYVSGQACMPSADVAVRLAKVLNTSVEYLVNGETQTATDESDENARKLLHLYKTLPSGQKRLLLAVAEDIEKCLGRE